MISFSLSLSLSLCLSVSLSLCVSLSLSLSLCLPLSLSVSLSVSLFLSPSPSLPLRRCVPTWDREHLLKKPCKCVGLLDVPWLNCCKKVDDVEGVPLTNGNGGNATTYNTMGDESTQSSRNIYAGVTYRPKQKPSRVLNVIHELLIRSKA